MTDAVLSESELDELGRVSQGSNLATVTTGELRRLIAEVRRLRATPSPAPLEGEGARELEYAQSLATFAAGKFGPPEGWKPLDDMMGVLSQIDNALTGLFAAPPSPSLTGWRPISSLDCCFPVLVGRPTDRVFYTPFVAFRDATGKLWTYPWDESEQHMRFEPTHWIPLPAAPVEQESET